MSFNIDVLLFNRFEEKTKFVDKDEPMKNSRRKRWMKVKWNEVDLKVFWINFYWPLSTSFFENETKRLFVRIKSEWIFSIETRKHVDFRCFNCFNIYFSRIDWSMEKLDERKGKHRSIDCLCWLWNLSIDWSLDFILIE